MVYRNSARGIATIIQLVRRVADNDIKLHLENLLGFYCMNELVGVALQLIAPVVFIL